MNRVPILYSKGFCVLPVMNPICAQYKAYFGSQYKRKWRMNRDQEMRNKVFLTQGGISTKGICIQKVLLGTINIISLHILGTINTFSLVKYFQLYHYSPNLKARLVCTIDLLI